jgi:hypothetical protein
MSSSISEINDLNKSMSTANNIVGVNRFHGFIICK